MTSNVRPPADHGDLFIDPAEMAQVRDNDAERYWAEADRATDSMDKMHWAIRGDRAAEEAKHYRRMAARGEQVPEF